MTSRRPVVVASASKTSLHSTHDASHVHSQTPDVGKLKLQGQRRLLTSREVPFWYTSDSSVRTGYRPVTSSARQCLDSLAYLHNETFNIYSHLIPATLALLGNWALHEFFSARYPGASVADRVVFHMNLLTAIVCFGTSSAYHTLLCHSEPYATLWVRLDYAGILFQIFGSFVSGIYVGFYCEPGLQRLYWSMIGALSLMTGAAVVSPWLQSAKWTWLRLLLFVSTGFSALAPIIHGATIFPYSQLDKQTGLRYYYLEGVLMLSGVALFVTHFPESRFPVRFDIWGASHQLFHILVVLGSLVHFYGAMDAFDWNYQNPRCARGY